MNKTSKELNIIQHSESQSFIHYHHTMEELFQLISHHIRDVITISSPDGRIHYITPSIQSLLGYTPEELLGKIPVELFHPEGYKMLSDSRLFEHSDEHTTRYQAKHKSGHYIWLETTIKLIRDKNGALEKVLSVSRDITERIKSEEEIRETKDQLESLIHNNADAIWIADTEDTVLKVNPTFEALFGWDASEVLGKPLPIIPSFYENAMQRVHDQIKSGESIVALETIRQRKDGSLLNIEATLSPFRDYQGQIVGMTGICRDVTRRKRTETELAERTAQFETFIKYNADAIVLFDNDGIVQRVNKTYEQIFGWSQDEVLGTALEHLPIIPDECMDEALKLKDSVLQGKSIMGMETQRKCRNGVILDVSLTVTAIVDDNGIHHGWSESIRDMTEWKSAQEQLQQSEKLSVAGQLAAGIAHEIRNPITSIKGFIQLMASGLGDKQRYFHIMSSEIERIELILSELLILAKPQAAKYERKDIRSLLEQVLALLDSQAILNDVQFTTDFPASIPLIHCDENQLKQVFINLIKNSIEAMPKGGTITVQIEYVQQHVLIRLIDQGNGIPEEVLSKLGQPFYTTKEKGTGLGFMVSHRIIASHAGSIQVSSELNKGTLIEIRLPVSTPEPPQSITPV